MNNQKDIIRVQLRTELQELRSADQLADYDNARGTLPALEWMKLKERIQERADVIVNLLNK